MASSTTIPKPKRKAKSTMVFRVKPKKYKGINANRADRGTESPTKMASRTPIKNIKTNTTKIKPSTTVLTKSSISDLVLSEPSAVILISKPWGKRLSLASSISFLIFSAAAIKFVPPRLITLSVTTFLLSKRAKSCCSSLLSITSATSPKRTLAPVEERKRMSAICCIDLNSPFTRSVLRTPSTFNSPPEILTFSP